MFAHDAHHVCSGHQRDATRRTTLNTHSTQHNTTHTMCFFSLCCVPARCPECQSERHVKPSNYPRHRQLKAKLCCRKEADEFEPINLHSCVCLCLRESSSVRVSVSHHLCLCRVCVFVFLCVCWIARRLITVTLLHICCSCHRTVVRT